MKVTFASSAQWSDLKVFDSSGTFSRDPGRNSCCKFVILISIDTAMPELNWPCLIHIGAPKTGTTFLQKVFAENHGALLQRGVLYPDVSLRGFGHHDLAFLLAGGYPDWATPQPRTLDELTSEFDAAVRGHCGPILISSENFYLYPQPAKVSKFLEASGVLATHVPKIIVYVRRQDDAHESWYNQTVKAQGYTHSIQECVKEFLGLWDYEKRLGQWASVFGAENLIVRPYEKAQLIEGSLLGDFCYHAGVSIEGFAITNDEINTKLNRDVLEFQRLVNQLPLTVQQKRHFHRDLMELTTQATRSGLFDESPILGAQERRELLGIYEEGNRRVAATYLRKNRLFVEEISGQSSSTWRGLNTGNTAAILAWLLTRRL